LGVGDVATTVQNRMRLRARRLLLLLALLGSALGLSPAAGAVTLPPGFFSGLNEPTNVEFASDGRVFVLEKSGFVLEYDSVSDTSPTTVADFRTKVHNWWDRGMLGLAVDPAFTSGRPYLYLLYTSARRPRGGARRGRRRTRARPLRATSSTAAGRAPASRASPSASATS
jgi:hypothetical protein